MVTTNTKNFRTVILGAGFGGLGMGAALKRAGDDDFIILERSRELGGVWRDNTYPGAACDTEAHLYCYSFFPHLRVSRMYADRDELMGYMHRMAKHFDLEKHILYEHEITSATWNEKTNQWDYIVNGKDHFTSTFFVPAWGQLNSPKIPEFKGLENFKGSLFHSAEWNHDVDLKGKNIASIGSAASAVQYVPEVAKVAGHLTVFQRTPNWIMPRNQRVFTKDELDNFEKHPETFEQSRKQLHKMREDGFQRTRHNSDAQKEGIAIAKAHLAAQVGDEALRAKLTPDFEFGCKRILRTDDYYPALMRDNVSLETTPIERFTDKGIVTKDGVEHKFDVVIFGTGFSSQAFQGDLVVVGQGGVRLDEVWSEGAQAYLGMNIPGFPNMFVIYGPNTNLNHNSILSMIEIQQEYIVEAIKHIMKGDAVTVRVDVFNRYNDDIQEDMKGSAFSSTCSSWYKNAAGRVINNWSGTVEDYRKLATWNDADFDWIAKAG
ncbi:NAD(P)/FAD-dependent oxidoreductase [uncultured Bartonella sp.]|uniref:flavin-containing monooxygenase n=1 Tax=uncultured Bartonella sp. TaxID=104108 RepID=UPI00261E9E1A|nr:NAD(P)/FAD-dependent oxidoreductase [uncultured Bartonella sp.]